MLLAFVCHPVTTLLKIRVFSVLVTQPLEIKIEKRWRCYEFKIRTTNILILILVASVESILHFRHVINLLCIEFKFHRRLPIANHPTSDKITQNTDCDFQNLEI